MNETNANAGLPCTGTPDSEKRVGARLASLSRRRLIRAGASSVPIVATLASRPVLGATCRTTSAWGSTQLMAHQSHDANHGSFTITTYQLTQWSATGNVSATPWQIMYNAGNTFGYATANALQNGLTVSQLFSGSVPGGWSGLSTASVYALLKGTGNISATNFQKAILVAMLNLMTSTPANPVGSCVTVDQLRDMGDGSYQPPNVGTTWGQPEIREYLLRNGLLGSFA